MIAGDRMRVRRLQLGLHQYKIARALGMSQPWTSKVEHGDPWVDGSRSTPDVDAAAALLQLHDPRWLYEHTYEGSGLLLGMHAVDRSDGETLGTVEQSRDGWVEVAGFWVPTCNVVFSMPIDWAEGKRVLDKLRSPVQEVDW